VHEFDLKTLLVGDAQLYLPRRRAALLIKDKENKTVEDAETWAGYASFFCATRMSIRFCAGGDGIKIESRRRRKRRLNLPHSGRRRRSGLHR
jgi:hypothetical protein